MQYISFFQKIQKHNNQHHGENWAVAVLVFISLALHSKPKPRQPSFACAGRYSSPGFAKKEISVTGGIISQAELCRTFLKGSARNSEPFQRSFVKCSGIVRTPSVVLGSCVSLG